MYLFENKVFENYIAFFLNFHFSMTKKNWRNYAPASESEQALFQDLLGAALGVKAILVAQNLNDLSEYIFVYNHPGEDGYNLVSFYCKVKGKKLLSFASAQLTEKMMTSRIKDYSNTMDLMEEVSSSIGYSPTLLKLEVDSNSCIGKSQYEYGLYYNGKLKGSFCCVLQHKITKEYVIVTSKHNCLLDGKYTLQSDMDKYALSVVKKDDTYDYALLSISPSPSFLAGLLRYTLSTTDQELITAYNCCNEKVGRAGNSGGNLHDKDGYLFGVYNGVGNVQIMTILKQNSDYNYIG